MLPTDPADGTPPVGIEALLRLEPITLHSPTTAGLEGRIRYALSGPAGAPVVTLVPGGSGAVASSAMAALWALLSRDHRTLVVETRGAPSVTMEPAGFTTADVAGDVVELLDELGIESTFVVGGSLGAMIGQHLAADLGERCRGAVLALAGAGGDVFFRDLMRHLAHLARTDPGEMLWASSLWAAGGDGFERWADVLPARDTAPAAPAMEGTARRFEAAAHHDARARLGSITAPVLVVAGERDLMLRPALGRQLAEALPHARLEVWPGATHMCLNEAPGRFEARCRAFFAAGA